MDSDNKIQICISRQTYSNSGYFVWRNKNVDEIILYVCTVQQCCEILLTHFH